ncbi:hypothetical protein LL999_15880 [Burkholderia ambifaria]|uniref:hypothetical protein n=1 Tax=Burkholderia ambifaria TaxID=152480 RepID=UPI001E53FEEC|nr:hypothetical protein [Burkholderia ambifaria]UEP21387.1 hypothetical protein LL999_15880 [Burkholderia ambifaria]
MSATTSPDSWDGETEWTPPEGSTVMQVETGTFVSIGYTYDGKAFAEPADLRDVEHFGARERIAYDALHRDAESTASS